VSAAAGAADLVRAADLVSAGRSTPALALPAFLAGCRRCSTGSGPIPALCRTLALFLTLLRCCNGAEAGATAQECLSMKAGAGVKRVLVHSFLFAARVDRRR
jgi:hypothetical protein